MIKSLLIANRGEIACRIIRTARKMGIRTVAVYSDADAKALHVRQADEAVHIGSPPARESYLVGEKIIAAAKSSGAEAIHPGYGFLSENAEFAQAVMDAGLVWVGPKPDSIRAMGLKDAAKERMIAAGVPVTPGYLGEDQSIGRLGREAGAIGYPVLIKAVAGGGGKGMRKVDDAADFADALLSCQREAASSFGNDQVLLEKWITNPRHIEVQVFGDTHGNVVHLFERDCSLQRRHQKVIEEAPAPGMDDVTRQAICAAAVRAAKAVDYVGAGTIEFIADGSEGLRADRIWFMEMNTRLQVEHPVTEEITGVDLVEWQLRVASGEPLPKRQEELSINGWAMEARLYAEDPVKGFLPSVGKLEHLSFSRLPSASALLLDPELRESDGLRIETGVETGSDVSSFYDPMIAKLVCHGQTRADALRQLAAACGGVQVWPVKSNAAFLKRLAEDADFQAGSVTTSFIGDRLDALTAPVPLPVEISAAALEFLGTQAGPRPWSIGNDLDGFRLNAPTRREAVIYIDGEPLVTPVQKQSSIHFADDASGVSRNFIRVGSELVLFAGGTPYLASLAYKADARSGGASDGAIISPMPGRIIALLVSKGEVVTKGQKLLTLEAMKMEHSLVAPYDGIVSALDASEGGQVSEGAVLARIEPRGE